MIFPTVYQIAFSSIKGLAVETASKLLEVVGSEERFFCLPEKELREKFGLHGEVATSKYRDALVEKAEKELAYIQDKGIAAYYFTEKGYPARLLVASDAPMLLYAKGECDLNAGYVVGVVGTRRATTYGLRQCRELVAGLKEALGEHVVIVSGLAYGIDVAAHLAAMEAGLPTVAVMAHGLDMIYPAQHRSIAVDIVRKGGAIVTEYGKQTRVHRSNFLARNRIIAGLSDCVVVVESASKGGALVTANIAQNYGRDVFAFPGRTDDAYSLGCNALIRKNVAALICNAGELIDMMGWERLSRPIEKSLFIELTEEEQKVVDSFREEIVNVNELCISANMMIHKLLSCLFELEGKGVVEALPGNMYRLIKNNIFKFGELREML